MNTLITAMNNLACFETHEIPGIGKINIKKATLADVEKVQAISDNLTESGEKVEDLVKMARLIAEDYIVDESGVPVLKTEDDINRFLQLPMDVITDILAAFKETFEKMSSKVEGMQKKQ